MEGRSDRCIEHVTCTRVISSVVADELLFSISNQPLPKSKIEWPLSMTTNECYRPIAVTDENWKRTFAANTKIAEADARDATAAVTHTRAAERFAGLY